MFYIKRDLRGIEEQIYNNHLLMLKQQYLSVLPVLEVVLSKNTAQDNTINCFRVFKEESGVLINDGFQIPLNSTNKTKENFNTDIVITVKNVGLSTANRIQIVFKQLKSVEGLSNLIDLELIHIENFYEKIQTYNYPRYDYDVNEENKLVLKENEEWFITPEFKLSNNEKGFNLVIDYSSIEADYFNILEFRYEDVYSNKYIQKMYLFFDGSMGAMFPLSKPFERI